MMSWLWRLAVIALITWIAVPFLRQEETVAVEEPTSTGAEVVESALTVWQRFWTEQTNTNPRFEQPSNLSNTTSKTTLRPSPDDDSVQQRFLQRLIASPEAVQLGREQVRRQAEEYGVQLTDEDVDRLLEWLKVR